MRTTAFAGVESAGMLCSEAELELGDDASRVLVLPDDAEPGTPLVDIAGIADTVLELEVTSNRGDCLSVLGIAREVAAASGVRLVTLDGTERTLDPADLVIADGRGPVALAGIMGGEQSEVTAGTRVLLLESAFFAPAIVRRTARRTGIGSEAAYRFERRVD